MGKILLYFSEILTWIAWWGTSMQEQCHNHHIAFHCSKVVVVVGIICNYNFYPECLFGSDPQGFCPTIY
jgi:hypothetical protein